MYGSLSQASVSLFSLPLRYATSEANNQWNKPKQTARKERAGVMKTDDCSLSNGSLRPHYLTTLSSLSRQRVWLSVVCSIQPSTTPLRYGPRGGRTAIILRRACEPPATTIRATTAVAAVTRRRLHLRPPHFRSRLRRTSSRRSDRSQGTRRSPWPRSSTTDRTSSGSDMR